MKYKTILSLFFVVSFVLFSPNPSTVQALTQEEKERLIQQIEILQQEVTTLKNLISNLQLRQEITAESYLAVDLSNNLVLLSKNSDEIHSIASVTKLMTAVIAIENIDLNQTITLTDEMLNPLGSSPTLFSGLTISAEDLLKACLIQSTNDAAEALSYFMNDGEFLALMNQKTTALGMTNTVFYDVHGLNPENRSNVVDIAKLVSYVYKNHQEVLDITKNNDFWLPDKTGRLLKFKNSNGFYYLPTFIGGKTGYLVEAKQALASVFELNGNPTAIVVLYSDNRQADTFAIIRKLEEE